MDVKYGARVPTLTAFFSAFCRKQLFASLTLLTSEVLVLFASSNILKLADIVKAQSIQTRGATRQTIAR